MTSKDRLREILYGVDISKSGLFSHLLEKIMQWHQDEIKKIDKEKNFLEKSLNRLNLEMDILKESHDWFVEQSRGSKEMFRKLSISYKKLTDILSEKDNEINELKKIIKEFK